MQQSSKTVTARGSCKKNDISNYSYLLAQRRQVYRQKICWLYTQQQLAEPNIIARTVLVELLVNYFLYFSRNETHHAPLYLHRLFI